MHTYLEESVTEIQDLDHVRRVGLRQVRRGHYSRQGLKLLAGIALISLPLYFAFSKALDLSAPFDLIFPPAQHFKFAPSAFSVDRDCDYFRTQAEAQAFFQQAGYGDPHRLDEDGDGIACENAWFDLSGWFGRECDESNGRG